MSSRRRTARAAAALALGFAAAPLTGCVQSAGCPGWAAYDTPREAAADADAVVEGSVRGKVRTTPMFGTDANVWSVEVEDWISGDGPERIEVVSPPENCGPNEPYFGSDPFEVALEHESSIVLLTGSEGGWQAITPLQGVVPAAPGGGIPEEW